MYILCKTHVHYRWQINIAVLVNMPKTETKLQCCSHFVDQHTRLNTAKLTFKKNLKSASLREHGGEDMKATQEKRGSTRGSRSYKPKAILISQMQPVASCFNDSASLLHPGSNWAESSHQIHPNYE